MWSQSFHWWMYSDIFYIFVSLRFPNSYTIFQVEISMYAAAKNNGNLLYFLREIPNKIGWFKIEICCTIQEISQLQKIMIIFFISFEKFRIQEISHLMVPLRELCMEKIGNLYMGFSFNEFFIRFCGGISYLCNM